MQLNRFIFADMLRIFATMAVITIHCVGQLFYLGLNSPSIDWWWTANIFSCLSRWAVPMFLMLSGMFLLDPEKKFFSIKDFLNKRLTKIVIPLIFWSLFYELYNTIYIKKYQINPLQTLQNIYSAKVEYHLWFLYLIAAIYLITPILRVFTKNCSEIEIRYFLLLWLISNGIIQILDGLTGLQNGFYFNVFLGYVGYYILGYYLNTIILSKKYFQTMVLIFCLSITATSLLNYFLIINRLESKIDVFINNVSLFTTVNCICIFLIVKSINWNLIVKNNKYKQFILKTIESFSRSSFGIYLVHVLVLGLLSSKTLKLSINYKLIHPLIGVPITIISTMIVSYVFVQCSRKIKLMNYILPY